MIKLSPSEVPVSEDNNMTNSLEIKKNSKLKALLVIALAFLMVPLVTFLITYYSNENFRHASNKYLSVLPGGLGRHFSNIPTREEEYGIKREIAKYYITFDDERLVDKLMLIRNDNQQLFNDLIPLLNRENPVKMARVNEVIRNTDINSDVLQRIIEDMNSEKTARIDALIKHYSGLKQNEAVREIEKNYSEGEVTQLEFTELFSKLQPQQAANYLYYLNSEIRQDIMFNMAISKRTEVTRQMDAIELNEYNMKELAEIYESKKPQELFTEIGSNDKYNNQNLALIYQGLSLKKAAEVLALSTDKEFVLGLYDSIGLQEALVREESGLAVKLATAVQVMQSYETNLKELLLVYEKLSPQELAALIEQMLRSNQVYQRHQFDDEEIVFTQEQLVMDVLKRMKPAQVANILAELSTTRSVELSNKLMRN